MKKKGWVGDELIQKDIRWSCSSRTDKKVHSLSSLISCKLKMDFSEKNIFERSMLELNEDLKSNDENIKIIILRI